MLCQLVVIIAVLILFKPKCVTEQSGGFQTQKLSILKILIISVGAIALTYFYPVLKKFALK